MTRRLKSFFGVFVLLAGCSMLLWPGVFTTSSSVDASPAPTIDAESLSATSQDAFLSALGIGQQEPEELADDAAAVVSEPDSQEDEAAPAPGEVGEAADVE